jgi:hypothetical protein
MRAGFAFEQAAGIYRQQPPMAASLPAR